MRTRRRPRFTPFPLLVLLGVTLTLTAAGAWARSADGALRKMDADGDGRISQQEWRKKRIFAQVDTDGDGYASRSELQVFFGEAASPPTAQGPASEGGGERPDPITLRAMYRDQRGDLDAARERGLIETGLHPAWPDDVDCPGIDHGWAMDYSSMRGRPAAHGGIDIQAPKGAPVRAAMAGEVIALYGGERSPRGVEVVLRHTPDDSGLPYILYSRYTHLAQLPGLRVGQRMALGEVLGETGNSGFFPTSSRKLFGGNSKSSRYRLHFDVLYSENPKYHDTGREIIPFDAYYMDPNALYRDRGPFNSVAMRDLPDAEKRVSIAYRLDDGTVVPPDARRIWPYACSRD